MRRRIRLDFVNEKYIFSTNHYSLSLKSSTFAVNFLGVAIGVLGSVQRHAVFPKFPLLCDGNWLYFFYAVLRPIRYARQLEKTKGKEKAC